MKPNPEGDAQARASDITATILGGFIWIAVIVGLPLALFSFGKSVALAIYPFAVGLSAIAIFIAVPTAIVCSFFRKSRPFAALAFLYSVLPILFGQWLACFVFAFEVSKFWLIVGVLMFGVGVFPISMVELLMYHEWQSFWLLCGTFFLCFILRSAGMVVLHKIQRDEIHAAEPTTA